MAVFTWSLIKNLWNIVNELVSKTEYVGSYIYGRTTSLDLQQIMTDEGLVVPDGSGGFDYQYFLKDHLGNNRILFTKTGPSLTVLQENHYYPFGMKFAGSFTNNSNKYLYNGKEMQDDGFDVGATGQVNRWLGWYDYHARQYDPQLGRWHIVDPLAEEAYSWSPFRYGYNNPLSYTDPTGMLEDWVEKEDGTIYWDDNATSQETTKEGETYLGKNVLVGNHNRDEDGNEEINSASFDLYLETDKTGPTATIEGNTVPANTEKFGTLAEGVYDATYTSYKGDGALLIEGGGDVPTVSGNPNNKKNYNPDGTLKPIKEHVMDDILFHKGNTHRPALSTLKGLPISAGCQTGINCANSLPKYRAFIKNAVGFKGSYYLRSKPKK